MFFSRRRGCAEPEEKAASVPTLTSRGLAAVLARRVVFAAVALVGRFAGVDLRVVDFLAGAFFVTFEAVLARTGRSLMARTSLSSDNPDPRPRDSGMEAVDGAALRRITDVRLTASTGLEALV
jgi:hypothetical protein